MGKKKTLRFAPSRNGIQISRTWRIWVQGNEFYAACRDSVNQAKISFHSGFNWQFRFGHGVSRLAHPLVLSGGWLHCLELSFLVDSNVLLPINQRGDKVDLINTPPNNKLLINLLLWPESHSFPRQLPPETVGAVIQEYKLRDGAILRVIARIMPINNFDRNLTLETRQGLKANYSKAPTAEETYVEANWQQFSAQTGNVIVIIPVGIEVISSGS